MSLLTTFNEKKSKLQDAGFWAECILEHKDPYVNKGYWQCRRYSTTKSTAPLLSDIQGLTPAATMLKADMNTYTDWAWANSYIGYMQCYVKCSQDYNLSCQFYTDDEGRFYCNGIDLGTSKSCAWTSVTVPLKKGWNKLQILYREGSGGDGAAINTKLQSLSYVEAMYANLYNDTTSL